MNETPISVEDFDLNRHAVVEASAGTGKTYTIEQLVMRLLTLQGVTLEKILIVTFTEKATGELRTRLRGALEKAIQKDDAYSAMLKPAADQFDQAPIFTIHGFCQRLLQEYALEQGQDFRAQLVNDIDLLKTALREIQQKQWRKQFGPHLRRVLETAGYNRERAEDWERGVLELAARYKPRCGHQLRPAFVPEWWKRLDEPDADWAGQLDICTIQALHQHLRDFKRQRGLQSFDDMIATVEESLDPDKNRDAEIFLKVLRERYPYGIVDEFQDTDPLQWRIFRRVFLDGGDAKLFVVGDPKQAIFAFRGADLPTYVKAVDEMKTRHGAANYALPVNWRSDPDLLEALNCVFEDGEWFADEPGVRYVHVHAPDDDRRRTRIEDDRTDRPALTMVDMTQWERLKQAQKNYARFVAHEIQRLLGGPGQPPRLTFSQQQQEPRALNAGDIAVLVMRRAEAEPIMQALDQAGIPFSFYKQTGLWQSDEAKHVEVLLQALARPEDPSSLRKALLTCFFRVRPEELVQVPDVSPRHPARMLFQTWIGDVENRRWSALFRSLLEDTGILFSAPAPRPLGEGLGVRGGEPPTPALPPKGGGGERALTHKGAGGESFAPRPSPLASPSAPRPSPLTPHTDRRITNLRQILLALEQVGHGANLDLLGLIEWMRERRRQLDAKELEFQAADMGRPKVKIMTIHVSKGLEFPVVFLAGGFTGSSRKQGVATYRDDEKRVVFDLRPDADAFERVNREMLSEQRRLLYVALTRAMFKLYVPKVKMLSRMRQYAGPVGTILLPALEQACPDKLGNLIAEAVLPPLSAQVTPAPKNEPAAEVVPAAPFKLASPLFPGESNWTKRRIAIRSFSSMSRHHLSQVGEGSSFGEQAPIPEDEAPTPADQDDPLRGPVFGDMVHNVLEFIDFADVARAAAPDALVAEGSSARPLVDDEIRKNLGKLRSATPLAELEPLCRRRIADLVWHALRTPLRALGGPLCDIPRENRLTEVEFLFPEDGSARQEEPFITGFMDLLFRKDGKYYLLDYKTNLLPSYSPDQIERSMKDSDYHRQYTLYMQAIRRWLRRFGPKNNSFLDQFGGVYYLYVRGLNGRDETTGVYFHRPTEQAP